MRGAVCSIVFLTLLLTGFLVTPSLFKIVNTEYQIAISENREPLQILAKEAFQIEDQIRRTDEEIAKIERMLSSLVSLKADLSDDKVRPLPSQTMDLDRSRNETLSRVDRDILKATSELDSTRQLKKSQENQLKGLSDKQTDIKKIIERAAAESTNVYLVTRALALGAIGAILSLFATFGLPRETGKLFDDYFLRRVWMSMAIGSVVSVVALGLLHTRQISVFTQADAPQGIPDFWRVTILCLLAGAFSDRLFQAAAGRVEQYLGSEKAAGVAPSQTRISTKSSKAILKNKKTVRPSKASATPTLVKVRHNSKNGQPAHETGRLT